MDSKYSNSFEDDVQIDLEKRSINSKSQESEKKEEVEEEEYWDYEDGGQSMEELERLEQLEKVFYIHIRIIGQKNLSKFFYKWKALSQRYRNKREERIIEEKLDKISIEDKLTLLNDGINIMTEDYKYNVDGDFDINKYKNLIPNLLNINQELPLIKINKKEKIIDLDDITNIRENIYDILKPNKSVERKEDYVDFSNNFKKEELFNDINNINNNFNEKIINKKYNNNEKLNERKNIEIVKNYYSEIIDNKKEKENLAQDLKIMNVDYQINRPAKNILNIKNHIENENQINDSIINFLTTELISTKDNNLPKEELIHPGRVNPDLKQIPEKLYRIIDITKEKNESILFKQIKQNNPIIKDIAQPLIYTDEIDKIPHEISIRPKKLLHKINK